MGSDSPARNGWKRGLIHFHTRFSDGGATVKQAACIARDAGYDFLIVTDHMQMLPRGRRRFDEYIQECDAVASDLGFLVIPGGEIELGWKREIDLGERMGEDFSEAHTLALSIRTLLDELEKLYDQEIPYDQWQDGQGRGNLLALHQSLQNHGISPAAAHQFQHSYLRSPLHWKKDADYRYDLEHLRTSRFVDFFYSGVLDAAHETEDFIAYLRELGRDREEPPAIYSSCDYHHGLQTLVGWLTRSPIGALHILPFAKEQLTHATYVNIGENTPLNEETVLKALAAGRTCVTRGRAVFQNLQPVPSGEPVPTSKVRLCLNLPETYSVYRPRIALIYRDGSLVHQLPVPVQEQTIEFSWTDPHPPSGVHHYILYIPSKFLSSPITVEVP